MIMKQLMLATALMVGATAPVFPANDTALGMDGYACGLAAMGYADEQRRSYPEATVALERTRLVKGVCYAQIMTMQPLGRGDWAVTNGVVNVYTLNYVANNVFVLPTNQHLGVKISPRRKTYFSPRRKIWYVKKGGQAR